MLLVSKTPNQILYLWSKFFKENLKIGILFYENFSINSFVKFLSENNRKFGSFLWSLKNHDVIAKVVPSRRFYRRVQRKKWTSIFDKNFFENKGKHQKVEKLNLVLFFSFEPTEVNITFLAKLLFFEIIFSVLESWRIFGILKLFFGRKSGEFFVSLAANSPLAFDDFWRIGKVTIRRTKIINYA